MQEIVEFRTAFTDAEATRLLTEARDDGTHWSVFQPPVYLPESGSGLRIAFVRVREGQPKPKILQPRFGGVQ